MPASVQVPPNLSDWWAELVEAGETDLGGSPPTVTTSRPEHPSRAPHQVRKERADGLRPDRAAL